MKNFQILIVIFILNSFVYCEEIGCLIDEDAPRISVGEKIEIEGLCQTITCESDNNIIIQSCPALTAAPPGPVFHVEQDFNKIFPDCCPTYEPNTDKVEMDNAIKTDDEIDNEKN